MSCQCDKCCSYVGENKLTWRSCLDELGGWLEKVRDSSLYMSPHWQKMYGEYIHLIFNPGDPKCECRIGKSKYLSDKLADLYGGKCLDVDFSDSYNGC